MSYGLVLGAGGATAWVFHIGVLEALREARGLEPADASIIIGTSAGASVGAAIRAGLDLDDIYRAVTEPPSPEQRSRMLSELRASTKTPRPLSPGLARHFLPGGKGSTFALAGLLPPGWFPTDWLAGFPGIDRLAAWPPGLWIPAVRATDAEVVVFGKDRTDVPVHLALEASSAVPGMFRPPVIDTVPFIDGAIASSTHAALLVDSGVDLAVISAPMAKPGKSPFVRRARHQLAAEVAALQAAGIVTVVVPGSAEVKQAARGFPRRNPAAAPVIAGHARTATQLAFGAA
jgi:NTE family protein